MRCYFKMAHLFYHVYQLCHAMIIFTTSLYFPVEVCLIFDHQLFKFQLRQNCGTVELRPLYQLPICSIKHELHVPVHLSIHPMETCGDNRWRCPRCCLCVQLSISNSRRLWINICVFDGITPVFCSSEASPRVLLINPPLLLLQRRSTNPCAHVWCAVLLMTVASLPALYLCSMFYLEGSLRSSTFVREKRS